MIEKLEFQGKMWEVKSKVNGARIENPNSLKENYGCDMVIRNPQNIYLMLNEIIDVEFEDVNENENHSQSLSSNEERAV